ncbi:hypothetical protein NQ318_012618 [Aromia moschata]|uniref:Uncharacterized protein n=1 Tax=Aromia moschata TaxID=1265417 RepID=A0AAV8YKV7_9CUCU|nr:hypothetical protein NQ318_012618 [Aromia moschata]
MSGGKRLHAYRLVFCWVNVLFWFGCCSVENYEDWYMIDAWLDEKWVPDTCCLPANYDVGCGKLRNSALYNQDATTKYTAGFCSGCMLIGVVGLMIAFIQLYGLISSMLLFCTVKHKRTSRTYKSYS